ncbi:SagB/ThcOx family dehydrogenase [Salmonella enterica]|nr:SagB/ThcOx family dehydrogenase [Salmonella enterica]EJJ3975108.1 SagB/ThcOx family dehydrogenase [Salmonella enterica]EJJ3984011.1 SagB/ThcOx family dehydrogenase [Salmonella enterica]EJJ3998015.1 SagB/ThcOx family dehydrogenase [Salmonella enterica]EJJ4131069.1 SagB/ThcOx family dehydrogenase [Salmonella enterica]
MHDFLLSVVNDTIDNLIQREVNEFHTKSQNRMDDPFLPFNINITLLTSKQTEALQWKEHTFGSECIPLGNNITPRKFNRKHSAVLFEKKAPLSKDIFNQVISDSFAATIETHGIKMPYPSGGALYSGQVIIFIKNVQGYGHGAYHYLPISNKLESLDALPIEVVEDALFMQKPSNFINYDFFILYGSLMSKHISKYGYRGYRLSMMEIGSMYRNMEIQSTYHHLTNRVWGGFCDEALSVSLGVDPRVIVPQVCQLIGRGVC